MAFGGISIVWKHLFLNDDENLMRHYFVFLIVGRPQKNYEVKSLGELCNSFNGCYKAPSLLEPSRWPQNQLVLSWDLISLSLASFVDNEQRHFPFFLIMVVTFILVLHNDKIYIMTGLYLYLFPYFQSCPFCITGSI